MFMIKCPKCGVTRFGVVPHVFVDCTCGATFNFMDGECTHGKKRGMCNVPNCDFRAFHGRGV